VTFRSDRALSRLILPTVLLTFFTAAGAGASTPGEGEHAASWHRGIVVAADSLAAAVGLDVLKSGGNAIDAAVAVGFALAVTYPEAGNLGGGGFMLIRTARGENRSIDFRETAPALATGSMFLDSAGNPVREKSLYGPLAAGVPGSVAGLLLALDRYGVRNREAVLGPALRLASRGFRVNRHLAASLDEMANVLERFPSTRRLFFKGHDPLRQGDTLVQPELAETIRQIIRGGTDGFYTGRIAHDIVRASSSNGGIISLEDLDTYHASERKPLVGSYRGYEIVTVPPPSAGGITLLEILNQLEPFDIRTIGYLQPRQVHLLASACQRAFADRIRYVGDPDFVHIPVGSLIAKDFSAPRWRTWDSTKATPEEQIVPGEAGEEGTNTTHFCTADEQGNVVSVTTTINDLFGCGMVVDGAGFFLNDEMDDFAVKPGARNLYGLVGGRPNAIAPGKRMVSSMTPTIVLDHGRAFVALGARGGGMIPTTVSQVLMNIIDFGMPLDSAVQKPRVHFQGSPDTLYVEAGGAGKALVDSLEMMDYHVATVRSVAKAQCLMIPKDGRGFIGFPDPREGGVVLGY
jgi:gamma-glutamyltranspeptidase/glutathione hydrolase